jgi:signal transduction histidine kinase
VDDLSPYPLSAYLAKQRESLLEDWFERVEGDDAMPSAEALSRQAFADHIPAIIDALIEDLEVLEAGVENSRKYQSLFSDHGEERWRQGFDLSGVVRDWNHLRAVLSNRLTQYFDEGGASENSPNKLGDALCTLSELIDAGINHSIGTFERLRAFEAEAKITDLSEALRYLRAQFADRSVEIANSSHDLKGAMDVMLVLSEEIAKDLDEYLPQNRRERIQSLFSSLKVGLSFNLRLVEEMLLIARLEAGQDEPMVERFNATPLIESVCDHFRPIADGRAVQIKLDGPKNLDIQSDSMKLSRILHNLVSNALKYTRKGLVFVRWERVGDNRWQLMVADSGDTLGNRPEVRLAHELESNQPLEVEIAPDVDPAGPDSLDRGFPAPPPDRMGESSDPILRRRHAFGESNGLGLSIVKRLTDMLDGAFYLNANHDEGVRVRIVFPVDLKL